LNLIHRSQSSQAMQLATMLQLATLTISSEIADIANAADYEQTAKRGQY